MWNPFKSEESPFLSFNSQPGKNTHTHTHICHLDVSKNRGTPKWMVYLMENPIKMDDLGFFPYFWKHSFAICKGQAAFAHCRSVTFVDLTEVKELKSEAFQHCGSLRHVILPKVMRRDLSHNTKNCWGKKWMGWRWMGWKTWEFFLSVWKFPRLYL